MDLILEREYHPKGTNGELRLGEVLICNTIELPNLNNLPGKSCIPEGQFLLKKRSSPKYGKHLLVVGVPGRSLILFHPANDALKELKGCIAPVSALAGVGKGTQSRKAFEKLRAMVYAAIDRQEEVLLTIKTKIHTL